MKLRTFEEVRLGRGSASVVTSPAASVVDLYRELRRDGGTATGCLSVARTLVAWREAAERGQLRVLYVPDDDPSGALDWLDQSAEDMGMCEGDWKRTVETELSRVERDGAWGIVAQYRSGDGEPWENGDSVWGFIADDGLDAAGSVIDVASEGLHALKRELDGCCRECGRPKLGRKAGG